MLPIIENGLGAGSEGVIVAILAVLFSGRGGGGGGMLAIIGVDEFTDASTFYIR